MARPTRRPSPPPRVRSSRPARPATRATGPRTEARMRRGITVLAALLLAGLAAFYVLTMPRGLPAAELAALAPGDPVRGETWFWAGGCAGCHAVAKAQGEDRLRLGGGQ